MNIKIRKLTVLAIMVAIDVVLTSFFFRIPGMAPFSSVVNVVAACLLSPEYTVLMACICAIIRMSLLSVSPLAMTGAVIGALFASVFYKRFKNIFAAAIGEFIGTGVIGALVSVPVMTIFAGKHGLGWLTYAQGFLAGATTGSIVGILLLLGLRNIPIFKQTQKLFQDRG